VDRLTFRRCYVPERAQLVAAATAFEDWIEPVAQPEMFEEQRKLRARYLTGGSYGWISVVAATRFVPAKDWPADENDRSALLGRELDESLNALNEYLISLSLARQDPSIVPIARGDLPALCPVILETAPMPDGKRNGTSYMYQIHHNLIYPQRPPREPDEIDEAELLAAQIARRAHLGGEPFFPFYELIQQAIGYFDRSLFRTSAISTGSAIEVLFSTVIRETGHVRGESPRDYGGILRAPLKSQVKDHLSKYANCDVDLKDKANAFGRWWKGGYELRNRVVHEGYKPTRDESRAALDDAMEVVRALRSGMLSDPVTRPVGEDLQWGEVPDHG